MNTPTFTTTFIRRLMILTLAGAASMSAGGAPEWEEDEEEIQDLREQLTEREDESRVEKPLVIQIHGRPLTLLGQYENSIQWIDRLEMGDTTNRFGQTLFEQEIELESFYSFSPVYSAFFQMKLAQEEDLDSDTPDGVSDIYLERGETWFIGEEIGGSPVYIEVGRLDFEDDRLWWWDEDLDAVRIGYEAEDYEITIAAAREMLPTRSDRDYIEPEDNDVVRLIGEASWDFSDNHAIQLFLLSHDDQSRSQQPGEIVRKKFEDESDADLLWTGVRASGAWELKRRGLIGYWLDAGWVSGDEVIVSAADPSEEDSADAPAAGGDEEDEEDEGAEDAAPPPPPLPPGSLEIEERKRQDVRGWAFDVGATWMLPVFAEPRITAGYARGSGDRDIDDGTDRSFRQTGLEGNEPGFGGVQRFEGYGELLEPELSNMSIITFGVGCTIFESSSIDLVFHDYRLVEYADSLRDSQLDAELTGTSRDLGQGIDLVLALEEWERIEFEIRAAAFRPGDAFGPDQGDWNYGGLLAARLAF